MRKYLKVNHHFSSTNLSLYQKEQTEEQPRKNSQPEKPGFLVWQILNFLVLILSIMFEENH